MAAMLRCAYMLLEVPKAPGGRRCPILGGNFGALDSELFENFLESFKWDLRWEKFH